jgi:hypothetical protein
VCTEIYYRSTRFACFVDDTSFHAF